MIDSARYAPAARAALFAVALACLAAGAMAGCARDDEASKRQHLADGDQYAAQQKFREAIVAYKNAIQIDPMFGEARTKLAAAYEQVGDGGNALSEYVRAADILTNDATLQVTAGTYLLSAGRVDEALARADAALKRQPGHVDAHILRGNTLGGLNDLEAALKEMEEAVRLDPARGATYTHVGLVEAALGRLTEAEVAFKRAIELAPDSATGHLAIANFYWAANRLPEAEVALESALKHEPLSLGANHALAVFSLASGRLDDAEKYLKRLSELNRTPASLFTLAEYYVAARRSKDAISILEPMTKDARTAAQARHWLARAHASDGSTAKAHAIVDELLKDDPRNAEAQLLKGQLLLSENQREAGLERVKAATAVEPQSAAAQFTLGKALASQGDTAGAEAAFREVIKINPSAAAAHVELSTLELAAGTAANSLRSSEAAAAKEPNRLLVRLALVRSLLASREFDRAERELQQLLTAFPQTAPVHVQHGVLAASRGNAVAARAAFDKALALDPRSIEALAGLLGLDLNSRSFAAAKERLKQHLDREPPTTSLLMLAARTYGSTGDLALAETALKSAIAIDPTLLPAYGMLGQLYLSQQRLDAAQVEFDRLAKVHSNPVPALTMSGMILQAQGQQAAARERFERAVAIDARAAVAANNLALIYLESPEKLSEALKLAQKAADAMPDTPEILDTLGWVYVKSNFPALAIPPLERAVQRAPGVGEYRFHLGIAYLKSGDASRGREFLTKALSLDRDARWAEEARRALAAIDATR